MNSQLDAKITALQSDVAGLTTVVTSAEALISGISAQVSSAVTAALAAGATADELAELTALDQALKDQTTGLAAAVAANTPADLTPPTAPVSTG